MDKIFKIKLTEDGLGRYNALRTTTIYVVADNSTSAINSVFTKDTRHVEIVDYHPCLIVK